MMRVEEGSCAGVCGPAEMGRTPRREVRRWVRMRKGRCFGMMTSFGG